VANLKSNGTIYAVGAVNTDALATVANAKINGTTYSVGAVSTDALLTAADIKANTTIYSAGTINSAGAATLHSVVVNTTLSAEDLASTDDATVADDMDVGGTFTAGTIASDATVTATTTVSGADLEATDDAMIGDDLEVDGLARVAETLTANALVVNNTAGLNGDTTVATSKTLAVTDADKLTVGGVIVPQEQVITIPVTKAMISGGEVNTSVFIASDAWTITHVEEVHSVAESTATTLTVTLMKLTGTQAPSAGTNVTESEFSLKAAADTVQVGAVSTTAGVATLADGDRLGLLCAMTGVADAAEFRGGTITVHMKRV